MNKAIRVMGLTASCAWMVTSVVAQEAKKPAGEQRKAHVLVVGRPAWGAPGMGNRHQMVASNMPHISGACLFRLTQRRKEA